MAKQPVNFAWFELKVKEWGCMQALIDYDGWRQWREIAVKNGLKTASDPKKESAAGGLRTTILRAGDTKKAVGEK
jgi:osomolarity two-component system response regulator SSK1